MILTLNTHKRFSKTAEALLDEDLKEMRKSSLQVLSYIFNESEDESAHPASLGWFGYEIALSVYGTVMAGTVYLRHLGGYDVNKFAQYSTAMHGEGFEMQMPPWSEDIDVLTSHRSWLIQNAGGKYKKIFKGTPDSWPVLWPVIDEEDITRYDIVVAKDDKKKAKNLPKSVRKRVSNV